MNFPATRKNTQQLATGPTLKCLASILSQRTFTKVVLMDSHLSDGLKVFGHHDDRFLACEQKAIPPSNYQTTAIVSQNCLGVNLQIQRWTLERNITSRVVILLVTSHVATRR